MSTSAVFIGEEDGFAPNHFGDPSTIEPDLRVTISSEDSFAGRDPVLEAALSYRPG